MINSNWHPISCRFGVIAAQCSFFDILRYSVTLLGLRDNVRCPFWAHWKARSGLPISLIELFSLGVTAVALRANIGSKSAISLQQGPVYPKFQVERVAPTNHSSSQKTSLNDLSYGVKSGQIFLPFRHKARVWKTDGQTDGRTEFTSLDRVCIPCRAVKMKRGFFDSRCRLPTSLEFSNPSTHCRILWRWISFMSV